MKKGAWLTFVKIVVGTLAIWLLYVWFIDEGAPPVAREVVTVREQVPATANAAPGGGGFRAAARRAMPSVVNVYTLKQVPRGLPWGDPGWRLFGGAEPAPRPATSLGSGVVVSDDGYLLTNNHVVEGADEIAVVFSSGEATEARVVGTDPETDLAVLKVEAQGLAPIVFADAGSVDVGDAVLAIGNPFGVGQTVTQGIISATGRNRLGINIFENFIQTDAAINPGNSGGALVDATGALVGINTAIYSESGGSQGIGFAIPVTLARQVLEQIVTTGQVQRGWLGVEARDLPPELGKGVGIASVMRGGPAEAGGVRPGDIVLAIAGRAVTDSVSLMTTVASTAPGSTVEIRLRRGERELALQVQVGKRPPLRRQ
ncbi:S1C family serine protease [Aromatoleum evansii]|uniref:S1C family serine protease n=1 Tax=Aromatoleum evansii TaxID=59406 RepID=UPI00145F01EB|nr:trypsin-like peptidase domain-containing protein [Aromatoleum evansii]NMG29967.1 trypsin-like serine protease [Aromatoleum evansii]